MPTDTSFKTTTQNMTQTKVDMKGQKQGMLENESYIVRFHLVCTLTCLTLLVCVTRYTLTLVAVDLIYTGTAVLTGATGTFVYV